MLFLQITALVGVTLIIVIGTIFKPLQRLYPPLFKCAQCTGAWVGMTAGAFGVIKTGQGVAIDVIVAGGATSVLSLLVYAVLVNLLGAPDPEQE